VLTHILLISIFNAAAVGIVNVAAVAGCEFFL
jgi:hypothetical protein